MLLRPRFWSLLCAAALGLPPAPVAADTLHLTSGRPKEGIILEETDTSLKLETSTGVVGIPLTMIESITRASKDENRELRRAWAAEARQKDREKAQRRAARRARRQAESARKQGTVDIDGEQVTHVEGARRREVERRAAELERRRVEAFGRAQMQLPEENRVEGPLVLQNIATNQTPDGILVRAEVYNLSKQAVQGIQIQVLLLEEPGTPEERMAAQQVIVADIAGQRIYKLRAPFPVSATRRLTPRLSILNPPKPTS